jgi:hypothetical protein
METTSKLDIGKKIATILAILVLLTSSVISIAFATTPPNIPGNEVYMNDDGVLASDTYILYPYEDKNLYIGFSKYGELIDGDAGVGLKYDGIDVFANPAVPENKWSNGWVMDIHYVDQGHLKNIWAYALYSDLWAGPSPPAAAAIGGDWRNEQKSKDASALGDTHGGRRTNGYAESDDIRLIYDGPRKAIYLLKTRIYDKAPPENQALVELTIQLVFNKVKKYVMEIKDIKRIDENKMTTPFQIEFSQRGQWDLGDETNCFSYAEFYNGLITKYNKHPFYTVDTEPPWGQEHEVTYDLCQIIADDEELVGFAAFWPHLISKWVDNTDLPLSRVGQDDLPNYLTTMETKTQDIEILGQGDLEQDKWYYYYKWNLDNTLSLRIPDETLVEYPRGAGEWSAAPWVFKWDEGLGDWMVVIDDDWTWDDVNNYVNVDDGSWEPGDTFLLVFKREMKGHVPHELEPMDCCEDMFMEEPVEAYGMYAEPRVPYVFAEWDFDLDWIEPDKSSNQFRCVALYGITDNNDAVDPDMDGMEGTFKIDEEVKYQLNEAFNPWDLKDAAHKDTFRWAQKGTIPAEGLVTLEAHLYDKYGNIRDCLEGEHIIWFPDKWGEYCNESEKVLLYDSTGTNDAILLEREDDYTAGDGTIEITMDTTGYDLYKVLYSTILLPPPMTFTEDDFSLRELDDVKFGVDMTRTFHRDYVEWVIDMDETDIEGHTAAGADIFVSYCNKKIFKVRGDGLGVTYKVFDGSGWVEEPMPCGIEVIMEKHDAAGSAPDYFVIRIPYDYTLGKCFHWSAYVEATFGGGDSDQMVFPLGWAGAPHQFSWTTPTLNMYKDGVCWHDGRWEWIVIGEESLASDSIGSAMMSATWADWKKRETWISGLDVEAEVYGPAIPYVLRPMDGDYRDSLGRTHFKDDWCTPDDWSGAWINPYAISSSNVMVVGGPLVNLAAEYFNDFTDALVFTEYGDGFYAPGCWSRTITPTDDLWYESPVAVPDDYVGYAIVSTYKDLNETIGFIVYGYTAEDTYYTSYALRGGGLAWLQEVQCGVTTVLVRIDYNELHPVVFHVEEFLGPFTECSGAYTNFKDGVYGDMVDIGAAEVEGEADCLGLCYKLVDIEFCGEVHPDP